MGGHAAGEIASRIAVDSISEFILHSKEDDGTWPHAYDDHYRRSTNKLMAAVRMANTRVLEAMRKDARLRGMGTTVVACLADDNTMSFAHVGDSRAYLWRGGVLTRLSDDHSLVAEWVKAGALAPEEAALHPQRSVITRALGADWQVDVDTWTTPARSGDVILLCTDGLTGFVDEAAIASMLAENDDLDAAVNALVAAANAAGGEDNITAVAMRLEVDDEAIVATDGAAVVADERETGEIDALAESDPSPEGTAVAVAVAAAPPVAEDAQAPAEPLTSRAVPVPLPRSGETLISVPPVVTGFGSGAPVRRRGRARRLGVFAAVVALMLCVLWAGLIGLRWSHFVGVDPASGKVAVYQGIPYDLGGGIKLFTLVHVSRIPAATLPAARRKRLFDHSLRSSESARSLVAKLEQTEP